MEAQEFLKLITEKKNPSELLPQRDLQAEIDRNSKDFLKLLSQDSNLSKSSSTNLPD